jgi:hypothetical protein
MLVKASSQEIAKMMTEEEKEKEKNVFEPGSHILLIYDDSKILREVYGQYSRALLPENEIVLIGTQYDTIENVKNALRLSNGGDNDDSDGIDVERYLNQGTLFIVDAQHRYHGNSDFRGMWKLAMSLLSRAKKEGRRGVTWFGDVGSFFGFEKIEEMIEYELSLPQKNEEEMMKVVCCYHSKDFESLSESQKQTLLDHHFKSILVE